MLDIEIEIYHTRLALEGCWKVHISATRIIENCARAIFQSISEDILIPVIIESLEENNPITRTLSSEQLSRVL